MLSKTQKAKRKPKTGISAKGIALQKLDRFKRYACQTCGKSYAQPGTLNRHIKSKHEGKLYHCADCKKTFTTYQGHWNHVKIVHEKTEYQCKECGKRYKSNSSLLTHKNTVHKKIRYTCKTCGTQHTQLTHLKTHKKTKKHLANVAALRIAAEKKDSSGHSKPVLTLKESWEDNNPVSGYEANFFNLTDFFNLNEGQALPLLANEYSTDADQSYSPSNHDEPPQILPPIKTILPHLINLQTKHHF